MSYTKEDYLVAVLKGECNQTLPKGIGFETKTISYQAWAASQKMKQVLRDLVNRKLGMKT